MPEVPPGMIDFTSNVVVGLVDFVVDDVVGSEGPLNINKIVNVFTNDTGSLSLQEFLPTINTTFSIGTLATLSVGIEDITISGLNTWSRLDLLKPSSAHELSSMTKTDHLHFEVNFFINATTTNSTTPFLSQKGNVVLSLSESALNGTLQLALNATKMQELNPNLDQWVDPICLMHTVYGATVLQAETSTLVELLSVTSDHRVAKASSELRYNQLDVFSTYLVLLLLSLPMHLFKDLLAAISTF